MKNILLLAAILVSLSFYSQASMVIEREEGEVRKAIGSLKFDNRFQGIESKVTVKWIHENFLDGNEGMSFKVVSDKQFRLALAYTKSFKCFDKIMELEVRHKVDNAIGKAEDEDEEGYGYAHPISVAANYLNARQAVPLSPFFLFVNS